MAKTEEVRSRYTFFLFLLHSHFQEFWLLFFSFASFSPFFKNLCRKGEEEFSAELPASCCSLFRCYKKRIKREMNA